MAKEDNNNGKNAGENGDGSQSMFAPIFEKLGMIAGRLDKLEAPTSKVQEVPEGGKPTTDPLLEQYKALGTPEELSAMIAQVADNKEAETVAKVAKLTGTKADILAAVAKDVDFDIKGDAVFVGDTPFAEYVDTHWANFKPILMADTETDSSDGVDSDGEASNGKIYPPQSTGTNKTPAGKRDLVGDYIDKWKKSLNGNN